MFLKSMPRDESILIVFMDNDTISPSFIERTNKIRFEVFLWLSIYLASLWFKHISHLERKKKIKMDFNEQLFLLLVANLIEQVWNWNVSLGKLSTHWCYHMMNVRLWTFLICYTSCNDFLWLSNNFCGGDCVWLHAHPQHSFFFLIKMNFIETQ